MLKDNTKSGKMLPIGNYYEVNFELSEIETYPISCESYNITNFNWYEVKIAIIVFNIQLTLMSWKCKK